MDQLEIKIPDLDCPADDAHVDPIEELAEDVGDIALHDSGAGDNPKLSASRSTTMGGVPRMRMHVDEVETDENLVHRLLEEQFPQWSPLPIQKVDSWGTDHDIYRLGDLLAVRLPRIGWAIDQAAKEGIWLPKLAPQLPVAIPVQLASGRPSSGYPFDWSVYEWLPGDDASSVSFDLEQGAIDLAGFVASLQHVDTAGAHDRSIGDRGAPLAELDEQVRQSIAKLDARIDAPAAIRCWDEAVMARPWDQTEVWVHGDLLPGNLLVVGGRISAIIDFGGLNVGDPSCDLQPAWNVFTGQSRDLYRTMLGVDHDSWLRGRGWVVSQAVSALAYYWDTNPGMVRQASWALGQVLNDR